MTNTGTAQKEQSMNGEQRFRAILASVLALCFIVVIVSLTISDMACR